MIPNSGTPEQTRKVQTRLVLLVFFFWFSDVFFVFMLAEGIAKRQVATAARGQSRRRRRLHPDGPPSNYQEVLALGILMSGSLGTPRYLCARNATSGHTDNGEETMHHSNVLLVKLRALS